MLQLDKGMLRPMEVTAPTRAVTEPKADLTVDMSDFSFHSVPTEVKAGAQTWQIVNKGPQPHELALNRLAPEKTMQDVGAWMAKPEGPPPFESVGGMQGLATGKSGWLKLDLTPGIYVALCFIPDPKIGKSHVELGMVHPFVVK